MIKNGPYIEISTTLSKQKQLMFGLLAAERFVDCYKIFSGKENFGSLVTMLESLRLIEQAILGDKADFTLIEEHIKKVHQNIPHTDDYGSLGGSLALNSSGIIYETLSIIDHFETRRLTDISTLCTDSIDFLILEIEDYNQMDFEIIAAHELMKEEVGFQEGIIKYLEKISDVGTIDIETLRLMQSERKFNKLDLERILYAE